MFYAAAKAGWTHTPRKPQNLSGQSPSILLRKTVRSLKSPTGAFIAALRSQTRTFPRCAWRRSGHTFLHFSSGTG
ncbi:hypothetical protein DWZ04_14915 [Faecalibacterium prausnitzii]|uniref:Uncharacterized protein n=1 Tax=Faecalibacterium prausnitzii TaxID=853 RepID=A0A3E2U9Q2_9FIRM|nr:hypothetical protein DWZ04_14915 [Faecalibacterium prausnitzii]